MAEEKAAPKTPVTKTPDPVVMLYLEHPHTRFDLSGIGLEDLVPEGTAYTRADADRVSTMCLKYGIRFREGQ